MKEEKMGVDPNYVEEHTLRENLKFEKRMNGYKIIAIALYGAGWLMVMSGIGVIQSWDQYILGGLMITFGLISWFGAFILGRVK